jgi:hypothetical protein
MLGILGLCLALLTGLAAIGRGIFAAGMKATRAEYAERDKKEMQEAHEELERLRARVGELEVQGINDVAEIVKEAGDERKQTHGTLAKALADISAGELKLRRVARACAQTPTGAGSKAAAPAGEVPDADADRRTKQDAEFLVRFAAERDEIAGDRNECAQIAIKDRERQRASR